MTKAAFIGTIEEQLHYLLDLDDQKIITPIPRSEWKIMSSMVVLVISDEYIFRIPNSEF